MIAYLLAIGALVAQRIAELPLSNRNAARLLARGGVESGQGHYPLLIGFHAAWLTGLCFLAWGRPIEPFWLAVALVLQAARAWVILSLAERWTTRIIVVPGEPLVRTGPYRWLKHPNYLVVALELAVWPLAFGLPWYALAGVVLNLPVVAIRVRAEDRALAQAVGNPLSRR